MRKYLAYYETEWPANIAELTAVENKPFVGVCGKEVLYTVIPVPVVGPADNEIWYTSSDGNVVTPNASAVIGANIVSNTYENGKGVIEFDNSVTSIALYAFEYCSSLTSITIPNSVTYIGYDAFKGCSSLTKTNYTGDIAGWCNIMFGGATGNPMYYSHNFYINDQEIKDLVIPNSVTSIGVWAFEKCSSLTSIVIPDSVTSIGRGAFYDCSSLSSIIFEGTMEEWNSITKGEKWNYIVPATYVQCTDGQVAI